MIARIIRALPALAVALALAQAPREAALRRDCAADALRLCAASLARGRTAVVRCMVDHRRKLSAACRRHLH
jgi:hypothetical protein